VIARPFTAAATFAGTLRLHAVRLAKTRQTTGNMRCMGGRISF
jgi:hypothetical protein